MKEKKVTTKNLSTEVKEVMATTDNKIEKVVKTAEEQEEKVTKKVAEAKKSVKKATEKKATEKKVTEKKAAEKKTSDKKVENKKASTKNKSENKYDTKVLFQYTGNEVDSDQLLEQAKADYLAAGGMEKNIKKMELYIKPEDNAAYYVINGIPAGKVTIFA